MPKPDKQPDIVAKPLPTHRATAVSGGVGGAIGVIIVVMSPKLFTGFTLDATEASLLTASLGIIFSFGMQYVPRPGGSIP